MLRQFQRIGIGNERSVLVARHDAGDDIGPAILHHVERHVATAEDGREIVAAGLLPARSQPLKGGMVQRSISAHIDGSGRALKNEKLPGRRAKMRDRLHPRGAGADDAYALASQPR